MSANRATYNHPTLVDWLKAKRAEERRAHAKRLRCPYCDQTAHPSLPCSTVEGGGERGR